MHILFIFNFILFTFVGASTNSKTKKRVHELNTSMHTVTNQRSMVSSQSEPSNKRQKISSSTQHQQAKTSIKHNQVISDDNLLGITQVKSNPSGNMTSQILREKVSENYSLVQLRAAKTKNQLGSKFLDRTLLPLTSVAQPKADLYKPASLYRSVYSRQKMINEPHSSAYSTEHIELENSKVLKKQQLPKNDC